MAHTRDRRAAVALVCGGETKSAATRSVRVQGTGVPYFFERVRVVSSDGILFAYANRVFVLLARRCLPASIVCSIVSRARHRNDVLMMIVRKESFWALRSQATSLV